MKTINFSSNLINTLNLENLKNELNEIGVSAFIIDYENQKISIMTPDSIEEETLTCAVRKAGYQCSCFKVCNHKKD